MLWARSRTMRKTAAAAGVDGKSRGRWLGAVGKGRLRGRGGQRGGGGDRDASALQEWQDTEQSVAPYSPSNPEQEAGG